MRLGFFDDGGLLERFASRVVRCLVGRRGAWRLAARVARANMAVRMLMTVFAVSRRRLFRPRTRARAAWAPLSTMQQRLTDTQRLHGTKRL